MDREANRGVPGLVVALRHALDDPAHRDAEAVRRMLLDRGWRPPSRPGAPAVEPAVDAPAEAAVVELLSRGWSAQEVAVRLGVPLTTLADELVRLRSAYGCTSTAEALRRARADTGEAGEH